MSTKEVLKQLSGLDYVLTDFNDLSTLVNCLNTSAAVRHIRKTPDDKYIMWYSPVRIVSTFYVESTGVQYDNFAEAYALVYEENDETGTLNIVSLVKHNDFT